MREEEDFSKPLTKEAEAFLEAVERRQDQGLAEFPFTDDNFVRLGADGKPYNPSLEETLRVVSG